MPWEERRTLGMCPIKIRGGKRDDILFFNLSRGKKKRV